MLYYLLYMNVTGSNSIIVLYYLLYMNVKI